MYYSRWKGIIKLARLTSLIPACIVIIKSNSRGDAFRFVLWLARPVGVFSGFETRYQGSGFYWLALFLLFVQHHRWPHWNLTRRISLYWMEIQWEMFSNRSWKTGELTRLEWNLKHSIYILIEKVTSLKKKEWKAALSSDEGKRRMAQWQETFFNAIISYVCVPCLSHLIASCEGVIHMMMIYSGPSVQWRGLNYYDNYHQNI